MRWRSTGEPIANLEEMIAAHMREVNGRT